jgi:cysteine synthase A
MQGWTPDFIPKLTEDAIALGLIDTIVPINGADALRCARELATAEGIFSGISGGGTLAGALQIAANAPAGANIVCMLPDTGERYLSTPLFDGVGADMTAEELEISRSTPGARFDDTDPAPVPPRTTTPPAQPASAEPGVSADVADFVARVLADAEQPLVLFALEWCEFCWAVRKLFAQCGIPYRSIDLDSTAYQRDDRGGQIRTVLRGRSGSKTIPQVYVAGEFIGGVRFDESVQIDPYSLLPAWLHPR